MTRHHFALLAGLAVSAPAMAFNPASGDWSKDDPAHLRVMTWNVQDNICSTANKTEGFQGWMACARIVAALKPDVLILQETGDNSGNGTGSGVDSVVTLTTTMDLFLHGGSDPVLGGTVEAYVQAYDPAFDMPFVHVTSIDDGFNRNVILSRFPFADLNGDGVASYDNFFNIADDYAPGGGGGIRGFMFDEIDLPDELYAGDLVLGNSHLKASGDSGSQQQRLEAAQNIAYLIDYNYNGAGTGTPDPNNKILTPGGTSVLGPDDIFIWGGDWNEDEASNGRKGPAEWMTRAANTGGTDGTDADRSDSTYDSVSDPFTGNTDTRGGSKLDYIAYQDSVGTAINQVVLYTNQIPAGQFPPEMASFSPAGLLSSLASDHQTVFVDFALPAPMVAACPADLDASGDVGGSDLAILLASWGLDNLAELTGDGTVDGSDLAVLLAAWGPCP